MKGVSPKGENPTGWMAYVRKYRELHPEEQINYKTLMQQYIKGESLETTNP